MSQIIIFVCHNNESISQVIHYNKQIILVGNTEINNEYKNNPNIIIARNLDDNIEYEPKLLTFTAWYAISKNKLFTEYDYICIFEYDVTLDENFENNLTTQCNSKKFNVISFIENEGGFRHDVCNDLFVDFLLHKECNESVFYDIRKWGSTTNHCLRRFILDDFVDWYFPSYLFIKERDIYKLSWYHERLFASYLKSKNIEYTTMNGLTHYYSCSHEGNVNIL